MVNRFNTRLQGLVCFAVLAALLAVAAPNFFAPGHVGTFAHNTSATAMLALGLTLVMASGGIDLSVAAVASLCGVVAAGLAADGYPLLVALTGALLVGLLCGLTNGTLAALARVPPFIATLAMLVLARGAARLWAGPSPITALPESYLAMAADLAGLPVAVGVVAVLAVGTHALLGRAGLGGPAALGAGHTGTARPAPDAPANGGTPGLRNAAAYVLCGAYAAVAGVLMSARDGMAGADAGHMLELYALAAVLIGGTGLLGGRGDALGTVLGALTVGVLQHALLLLDAWPGSVAVTAGAALLAAVAIDRAREATARAATAPSVPSRRPAAVMLAVVAAAVVAIVFAVATRYTMVAGVVEPSPRLALVLPPADDPSTKALREAAESEADRWGARLAVLTPGRVHAVAEQIQLMDAAVQMHVQAIVLAPAAASGLEPALRAAAEAGIPVLIAGRRLNDGAVASAGVHVDATVATDNLNGGELAGHRLAAAVGQSGEVAVISGRTSDDGRERRRLGFLTAVAGYPQLRVIATREQATAANTGGQEPATTSATAAILDAHPQLKGIFATDAAATSAVLETLARAGRADGIRVIGWGATPSAVDAIRTGRLLATAAELPEEMGRLAIMHAMALVREGRVPPERITTAAEIIDASSVDGFLETRAAPPRYRIGLVTQSSTNAYWLRLVAGAREAGRRHGAAILWRAPQRNYDVERQFEIVNEIVQERVDGILLAPSGGRTMCMAVHAANRAGIPILLVDSQLDVPTLARLGAHVLGYVGSDNYAGGELAAEHALSLLPKGGKVALLEGAPDIWSTAERVRGFLDVLGQRPDMQVVGLTTAYNERGVARLVASGWLEAHPDLDVIFAANGLMGLGAADAVAARVRAGRPLPHAPRIVAFDATEEVLQAIDADHIAATVAQQPGEMGRRAVETLLAFIEGRGGTEAVHILTDTSVVTSRTAGALPPRR